MGLLDRVLDPVGFVVELHEDRAEQFRDDLAVLLAERGQQIPNRAH